MTLLEGKTNPATEEADAPRVPPFALLNTEKLAIRLLLSAVLLEHFLVDVQNASCPRFRREEA